MQYNTNRIKILIAQDENNCRIAKEFFETQNDFEVVGTTTNGNTAIDLIVSKEPNIVLTDLVLQDKDGISVLDYVQNKLKSGEKPKMVVLTNLAQETFIQKAMQLGVSYYMIKPCNFEEVKVRIKDLLCPIDSRSNLIISNNELMRTNSQALNEKNKIIEERISTIFITVGIPANIKGYQFLREAVKLTIDKPEMINSITKQLYPSIADRFETTPSKVERAIRHAIEVAWNRGKIENINTLFGIKVYGTNEKPTNSEFIALIADKMLLEGA